MAARPKASEARDTRAEILDAALELFADKGYFGVSIRDVARATGVGVSALYHHFPSKEALFEGVVIGDTRGDGRPNLGPGEPPPFEGGPEDLGPYLEKLMGHAMDRFSVLRERKRFRIFLSDGSRLALEGKINLWEKMLVARQPIIDLMGRLMERGLLRRADPELMAVSFIAPLMMWRQLQSISPGHPWIDRPREYAHHCVEQFLNGARESGSRTIV